MSAWKTGNPPVADNKTKDFIVAVRRGHNKEKVFVFAATFANNFSEDELRDKDGKDFIANGWFTVAEDSSGEFNEFYTPMLDKGDEVVGWQEFPAWGELAGSEKLIAEITSVCNRHLIKQGDDFQLGADRCARDVLNVILKEKQ